MPEFLVSDSEVDRSIRELRSQGYNVTGTKKTRGQTTVIEYNGTATNPGIASVGGTIPSVPGTPAPGPPPVIPDIPGTYDPAGQTEILFDLIKRFGPELAELDADAVRQYYPEFARIAFDTSANLAPEYAALNVLLTGGQLPFMEQILAKSRERERDRQLDRVYKELPELRAIRDAAGTEGSADLRKLMVSNALTELQAGRELTPEQRRMVEQGSRSAELARGGFAGQGSANREAVASAIAGDQQLQNRMATAQRVLSTDYATDPFADPFDAVLRGTPETSGALAQANRTPFPTVPTAGDIPSPSSLGGALAGQGSSNAATQSGLYGTQAGLENNLYSILATGQTGQNAQAISLAQLNAGLGLQSEDAGIPFIPFSF